MRQNNTGDLVGPLHADSIDDKEELINSYIATNGETDINCDANISAILSGARLILSGVRGTGKTMILKTADAVLRKDIQHKLLDCFEFELGDEDIKLLPVYISFSGFKNDVSLQNEVELDKGELKHSQEIFRGYLFMSLLQDILRVIEELQLDKNVEFNVFGLRTKLGIRREVDKAIDTFKRLGFREMIKSKKMGIDIDLKVKPISLGFTPGMTATQKSKEITLDDMQKSSLFRDTIDSICNTYSIDKVVFLFDEVHYLKFLQREFFDILFGFRNYSKISFSISAYPTFMEYGNCFDVPDDAKEVSVASILYKPTKAEFEKPLIKLVEMRLQKYGKINYNQVISDEALELLILLTNGNPRILLQSIDFIWRRNNQKKINVVNITQDLIFEMVEKWYIDFMKSQAQRYKTNLGKVIEFLNIIKNRLNEYNNRNEVATSFFLINEEINNNFLDTINLLHYSRIIDRIKISSFGSSYGSMGKMYLLNPMVGWYYGIFSKSQINNLVKHIKESLDKDKKSQFDSLRSFLTNISEENNISCPRYKDSECLEPKCKGSYSEQWALCPFYPGLSLEAKTLLPDQVGIEVLNLSEKISSRLRAEGIRNLKHIMDLKVEGLQLIYLIGEVRSNNIYYAAKEYIDDNL